MSETPKDVATWLDELEGYSSRRERMPPEALSWVETAWELATIAERERCAAFAHEKHDWPARWIAASLRGESSAYTDSRPSIEQETGPQ